MVAVNIFQKQILALYYEIIPVFTFPLTSASSTQHVVLVEIIEFSFRNICFLMSSNSINIGLILFINQLFNVSIVNFNSTEKRSARNVNFLQERTAVLASLS